VVDISEHDSDGRHRALGYSLDNDTDGSPLMTPDHRHQRSQSVAPIARKLGIRLWILLRDQIEYDEFCRRAPAHATGR